MHRVLRIGWPKSDRFKKGDNVSFRRQLDDIGKQRNVRDFAYTPTQTDFGSAEFNIAMPVYITEARIAQISALAKSQRPERGY